MKRNILITGGAGFIGSNLAAHYIKKGDNVIVFDNLSRPSSKGNLSWLKTVGGFTFLKGDIRKTKDLDAAFRERKIDMVFHEAAQVAVTTSVINPREDFEVNALGTFNVLEAIRQNSPKAILIYSSTNKVYGGLEDIKVVEKASRYEFGEAKYKNGISESRNIDFHSPYGCSKGSADQYIRDYSRIYNLKTVVFRQSCIYGYRQIGLEDQGWLAWFSIRSIQNKKVTVYGDGKQVRDVLFVDDLVRAFDLAAKNIQTTAGKIYNIGGGRNSVLSLLETFKILSDVSGRKVDYSFADWRPGDQKIFVSDVSMAKKDFGWEPKISPKEGLEKLYKWLSENQNLFAK